MRQAADEVIGIRHFGRLQSLRHRWHHAAHNEYFPSPIPQTNTYLEARYPVCRRKSAFFNMRIS
jgi:hypothetical protein